MKLLKKAYPLHISFFLIITIPFLVKGQSPTEIKISTNPLFESFGKNFFVNRNNQLFIKTGNNSIWRILNDKGIYQFNLSGGTCNMGSFNGEEYFTNCYEDSRTLIKTDGTEKNSTIVSQLPGNLHLLVHASSYMLLVLLNSDYDYEIWKLSRSNNNLSYVKNINPERNGREIGFNIVMGDIIYFTSNDGIHGDELWKTDGTGIGTVLVKDITIGTRGSFDLVNNKNTFTEMNGIVYFAASANGSTELWRTDGTMEGTYVVKNIGIMYYSGLDFFNDKLIIKDNFLYFRARSLEYGEELWKSDGTEAGTVMVKDINSSWGLGSYPRDLFFFKDKIYFFVFGDLWSTDGSEENTVEVKHFENPIDGQISGSRVVNCDSISLIFDEDAVWKTDGTTVGTKLIPNLTGINTDYANPLFVSGKVYYFFDSLGKGIEPWVFDLNTYKKELVQDIDIKGSNPVGLTNLQNSIVVHCKIDNYGDELWIYDKDSSKVSLIGKFDGKSGVILPSLRDVFSFKENIYGVVNTFDSTGHHLSDITLMNKFFQAPLNYLDDGELLPIQNPSNFSTFENEFFFNAANSRIENYSTFVSNGTDVGTHPTSIPVYKEIAKIKSTYYFLTNSQLFRSSNLINFTLIKDSIQIDKLFGTENKLYLTKANKLYILENDNLQLLKEYDSNTLVNISTHFVNDIFFVASSGTDSIDIAKNYELWSSNGTSLGTKLVKEVNIEKGSNPLSLKKIKNKIYFSADDGLHGREIWVSDGTNEGTTLLKDINSGLSNSIFQFEPYFTEYDNMVYFIAKSAETGIEIYRTDGTENGTELVSDLFEGANSSIPQELIVVNNTLYFSASDGRDGRELWYYEPNCKKTIKLLNPYNNVINKNIDIIVDNKIGQIQASNKISDTSNVNMRGSVLEFLPGFTAEKGAIFKAYIGGCN